MKGVNLLTQTQIIRTPEGGTQESAFHKLPRWCKEVGWGVGIALSDVNVCVNLYLVKNPPAMQETQVQSLGWEDPLEKGMATHSSILAWRIPWTEEPSSPCGCKELDATE